jgi:cytosine/adenosine deaminase-related metal-dependent hydrolase
MTDIVIHDAYVLTVNNRNQLFERGTLVVEDGTIRDVRKTREEDATLDADRVIDASGKLAMPGLVNAHAHLELTALLGAFSEFDTSEMFLQMFAFWEQLTNEEYGALAEASCDLAALNFLRGGITTVNAMDAVPRYGAEAFGEAGLRGFFGPGINDLISDIPVDEQFDRARSFIEEYHGSYDDRIRATICPQGDWGCSREFWERAAALASQYPDLPVHTHLLEVDQSNTIARSNDATDSLALLDDVGLLNERLIAAHFRVADDHDVERIADNDAAVAHCPSILCYWSPGDETPWPPVPDLRNAGATVGIGLDDYYFLDSYDLFKEARQARLAANSSFGANQFNSMELVRMLTIEGARALGIDDEVGSLEAGKRADLILLDLSNPKFTPRTNIPALVTNTATAEDVTTVVVDGDVLVSGGEVRSMDAMAVSEHAETAIEQLCAETDWEMGVGGSDPPAMLATLADLPKRGPAHLLARLGVQSAKDKFGF